MKAWEVDRLKFAVKVYPGEQTSAYLNGLKSPAALYFDPKGTLVARQW